MQTPWMILTAMVTLPLFPMESNLWQMKRWRDLTSDLNCVENSTNSLQRPRNSVTVSEYGGCSSTARQTIISSATKILPRTYTIVQKASWYMATEVAGRHIIMEIIKVSMEDDGSTLMTWPLLLASAGYQQSISYYAQQLERWKKVIRTPRKWNKSGVSGLHIHDTQEQDMTAQTTDQGLFITNQRVMTETNCNCFVQGVGLATTFNNESKDHSNIILMETVAGKSRTQNIWYGGLSVA